MTVIKNLTFPNDPLIAYAEDVEGWDTEVVEGMTGASFRNSRRTVPVRTITLSIQDYFDSDIVTDVLAIKTAAEGRLFGFKFVSLFSGDTIDVAFKDDEWPLKWVAGTNPTNPLVTIDVTLVEVIDGIDEA